MKLAQRLHIREQLLYVRPVISSLSAQSAPGSGSDRSVDSSSAFAAAYDEHARDVYRVAHRVLRDEHLAEDVTHEVFMRYWRRPEAYDAARGELGSYLRVMARTQALDAWRQGAAIARKQDRLETETHFAEHAADDTLVCIERSERASAVRAAVRSLPDAQREAVALAYWGGLTADEIARCSGAPLGTVKSRIRLGLRRVVRDASLAAA